MRWLRNSVALMVLLSGCTGAVDRALTQGAELQRTGQPEAALRTLREARVEHPAALEILFATAEAEVALGDARLASRDLEAAARQYSSARETFARCGGDTRLAESAAYNGATCLLRLDRVLEQGGAREARLENLSLAVDALSTVVENWPGHERAAWNLNFARYRRALLLQEPPPASKEKEGPEESGQPVSEVAGATTQIPGATAEVVDGATVVLHVERGGEVQP